MAVCMKYGRLDLKNTPVKEPVFVFRAQDALAEKYLRMYAEEILQRTGDVGNYKKIITSAQNFQLWGTKKIPDQKGIKLYAKLVIIYCATFYISAAMAVIYLIFF